MSEPQVQSTVQNVSPDDRPKPAVSTDSKRGKAPIVLKNGKLLRDARAEAKDAVRTSKAERRDAAAAAKEAAKRANEAARSLASAEKLLDKANADTVLPKDEKRELVRSAREAVKLAKVQSRESERASKAAERELAKAEKAVQKALDGVQKVEDMYEAQKAAGRETKSLSGL